MELELGEISDKLDLVVRELILVKRQNATVSAVLAQQSELDKERTDRESARDEEQVRRDAMQVGRDEAQTRFVDLVQRTLDNLQSDQAMIQTSIHDGIRVGVNSALLAIISSLEAGLPIPTPQGSSVPASEGDFMDGGASEAEAEEKPVKAGVANIMDDETVKANTQKLQNLLKRRYEK